MRSILIPMVAACATFAIPAAAATVSIDTFQTAQTLVTFSGSPSATSTIAAPEAIGGSRKVTLTSDGFTQGGVVNTGSGLQAGLSAGFDVTTSSLVFDWLSLGGADLTDGGSNDVIEIAITTIDSPSISYSLTFDGVTVSKFGVLGSLYFDFTDFAGVDFGSIDDISLEISGPGSIDTAFSLVAADTSAIPLPAAGFLLIGGLGALGVARRRKQA